VTPPTLGSGAHEEPAVCPARRRVGHRRRSVTNP
jgi:hypothetical protein